MNRNTLKSAMIVLIMSAMQFSCIISAKAQQLHHVSGDTLNITKEIGTMFLPTGKIRGVCSSQIKMMTRQGYQTDGLQKRLDALPDSYDALLGFAYELTQMPLRKDLKYVEPFDLKAIQAACPKDNVPVLGRYQSDVEIKDRIYGGIFGQLIGLTLGQPFEMSWDLVKIKTYLEGVDAWPLNDFVPSYSPTQPDLLRRDCIESMKGFVHLAKEDDDLNYLVANTKILEEYGFGFKTEDVARFWYSNLVPGWTWGPENSRFMLLTGIFFGNNLNNYPSAHEQEKFVNFLNDGQEYIGAMIRGEVFGFVCPGNTRLAAELAWRDGCLTHAKTGLYAEMWLAATISAAFMTNDPVACIKAGLAQIPENSRYAECIREALKISLEEKEWLEAYKRINERWGHLGHAGTLNETAAIINGLVHSTDKYGNVDYTKAVTITIMHGWDADCSGAMAGAIAGVLTGYNNIPERWHKPLNNTYYSCIATERESRISALADRIYTLTKRK
ncbi:MAG: ADP-ribosylglycohydrolase family protein [Dysgonamonadaceae bacterium]|jgi:ADP-ribosylglycohydrolase|nr:ADP-ribosylglycohydrolase family protein [Dysgonamonadaceae bacterium]